MQTGSSSPPSLPKKTKKGPSPPTPSPSPSPSKNARSRRKGTDKIDNSKKCEVTFLKRKQGLFKKASALNSLTTAGIAVIMLSPKGELHSLGKPSVEELISEFFRPRADGKLRLSPKEGVDWAKKECDSCTTWEDCASLLMKYLDAVGLLHKKLKDFENNPSVNARAGHESGVGASRHPSPVAVNEDSVNADIFLTSLAYLATTGSEISEIDSSLTCSDDGLNDLLREERPISPKELLDWAEKKCDSCVTKEHCASLIRKYPVVPNCLRKEFEGLENIPSVNAGAGDDSGVGAGRGFKIFNSEEIHSLKKNYETHPSLSAFTEDGVDCNIFLTSMVDSTASGASSGMHSNPMCSPLAGFESALAGLINLYKDDGFWTWLLEESPRFHREGK